MGTKAKIMNLEIDLFTWETFEKEIRQYLNNDLMNVVHMISLDYIDTYEENDLVKEMLEEADMVLPGESSILTAHQVELLETYGMVTDYHCIRKLIDIGEMEGKSLYLIFRDKKESKAAYRYFNQHINRENIVGLYSFDGNMTEEALINDINTKVPDIIFLSMDSIEQEEWLQRNKNKLNAKLCLVAGSIMPVILKNNIFSPAWLEKIHLDNLYKKIMGIRYSNCFRRRVFKRKLSEYHSQKKKEMQ